MDFIYLAIFLFARWWLMFGAILTLQFVCRPEIATSPALHEVREVYARIHGKNAAASTIVLVAATMHLILLHPLWVIQARLKK